MENEPNNKKNRIQSIYERRKKARREEQYESSAIVSTPEPLVQWLAAIAVKVSMNRASRNTRRSRRYKEAEFNYLNRLWQTFTRRQLR